MCRYKLEDDVDIDEHFNKELFAIMQWMFPKHVDEDENNANASQSKVSSKNGKRKNAEGNGVATKRSKRVKNEVDYNET